MHTTKAPLLQRPSKFTTLATCEDTLMYILQHSKMEGRHKPLTLYALNGESCIGRCVTDKHSIHVHSLLH